MFRDFVVGTLATILRVVFILFGSVGLLIGILDMNIVAIVIGITLLCMAAGVRYALGIIVRQR